MKKCYPDGDGITNTIGGGNSNIGAGCGSTKVGLSSWGPGI